MKRIIFVLTLVAVGIGAWYWLQAAGYLGKSEFSSDPQVAELQRMQKSFMEQNAANPNARPSEDQRKAMGEKMRDLSDEQRREFFESGRDNMRQAMESRMQRFFTLSPEEQRKQLDEDIDRMEKGRNGRGGGPGGAAGSRSDSQRGGKDGGGEKANQSRSSSTNSGNSTNSGSADKQSERRPPRDSSPEARSERRKQMLSHTTPQQRAMSAEYRSRLNARRVERGLQPVTSFRGR